MRNINRRKPMGCKDKRGKFRTVEFDKYIHMTIVKTRLDSQKMKLVSLLLRRLRFFISSRCDMIFLFNLKHHVIGSRGECGVKDADIAPAIVSSDAFQSS